LAPKSFIGYEVYDTDNIEVKHQKMIDLEKDLRNPIYVS